MADVCKRIVERAEKSGRNITSYILSNGETLSPDEMKDALLAGEEIENVRLQKSAGKVWVRLRPTVPVINSTLVSTARSRAARRREVQQEQLASGLDEELEELLRCNKV